MIAHPIIDPDDGPAYANITHDHALTFKTVTVGGTCQVTNLVFSWNFIITLPKAADYAGMNGAAEKMTGPAGCAGLDRKVRAFVDRQYAICMTRQRDFDRSQRATVDGLALMQ